ncbi:MAG: hypothetical protein Q7S74_03315 [Nanoarchaeota archaeon]|nr:hypothetical protein [Nanoarchaeota archaeon]
MNRRTYISELKHLRYDWVDRIPDELKDSLSREKVKARKAWFSCVALMVSHGLRKGYLNGDIGERFDRIWDYTERNIRFEAGRRTTRKEIDSLNVLLDDVLLEMR